MATRSLVPRNNNEGSLGRPEKKWLGANITTVEADTVNATTVEADTVNATTVEADTVNATTVEADTVNATTVEADTVNATGWNTLQRNKYYEVGNIAYSAKLPSYLRLECVIAGTTGASEPEFSAPPSGQ